MKLFRKKTNVFLRSEHKNKAKGNGVCIPL